MSSSRPGISKDTNSSSTAKNSFRRARARASRACEVCHARKVRCDVTIQMPCTNCVAFGCECRIPDVKKRRQSVKNKSSTNNIAVDNENEIPNQENEADNSDSRANFIPKYKDNDNEIPNNGDSAASTTLERMSISRSYESKKPEPSWKLEASDPMDGVETERAEPSIVDNDNSRLISDDISEDDRTDSTKTSNTPAASNSNAEAIQKMFNPSSVKTSEGITYLGQSSNLNLLLDHTQTTQKESTYHFRFPEGFADKSRPTDIDDEELRVLKERRAFLLPPRDICDDLVHSYFDKIHPLIPLINQTQFMRRYNDPMSPPSMLLLQAILLAGSRVCRNEALLDENGLNDLASLTFYKRAKALYDSNYETDRITIVQSLILIGWFWGGPEDVTKNVFYWTRVAINVAQGFGLHRNVEGTSLSLSDKRLWKRVWWVLFIRDRAVAVPFGRPVMINLDDSDVPMITEDDFIEDEPGFPSPFTVNRIQVLYFIQMVKLSEIMGLVMKQQYSVRAEISGRKSGLPAISQCDMAMGAWMNNLPPELKYSVNNHSEYHFLIALLHSQYYTILCLVHSNALNKRSEGVVNGKTSYSSWGISFQAAHMVTKIIETMVAHDDIRNCPGFIVYSIFSAIVLLIYQVEAPNKTIVESANKGLDICMKALHDVAKTWPVARTVENLVKFTHRNEAFKAQIVRTVRKHTHSKKSSARSGKDGNVKHSKKAKKEETPQKDNNSEFSSIKSDINVNKPDVAPGVNDEVDVPSNSISSRRSFIGAYQGSDGLTVLEGASQSTDDMAGNKPNGTNNYNQGRESVQPDFFFFVNTPPSSTSFFESFQPIQLFPSESQDNSSYVLNPLIDEAFPIMPNYNDNSVNEVNPTMALDRGSFLTPTDSSNLENVNLGNIPAANFSITNGIAATNLEDENSGKGSDKISNPSTTPASSESQFNAYTPNSVSINDWYNYLISQNSGSFTKLNVNSTDNDVNNFNRTPPSLAVGNRSETPLNIAFNSSFNSLQSLPQIQGSPQHQELSQKLQQQQQQHQLQQQQLQQLQQQQTPHPQNVGLGLGSGYHGLSSSNLNVGYNPLAAMNDLSGLAGFSGLAGMVGLSEIQNINANLAMGLYGGSSNHLPIVSSENWEASNMASHTENSVQGQGPAK